MSTTPCPCGLGRPYERCCGRLHNGEDDAFTAEALMRSRYSAFVLGDVPYLERSWHPSTRPRRVTVDPAQRWTGLDVVASEDGGPVDEAGIVEFVAHFER